MVDNIGRKSITGRKGFEQRVDLKPKRVEGLPEILDRVLDKGIVIDAKTRAYLVDLKLVEAEGIITLASFKTAARLGLNFPKDTNFEASGWKNLLLKEECPQCRKLIRIEDFETGCPFCGFLGE